MKAGKFVKATHKTKKGTFVIHESDLSDDWTVVDGDDSAEPKTAKPKTAKPKS